MKKLRLTLLKNKIIKKGADQNYYFFQLYVQNLYDDLQYLFFFFLLNY